MRCQSCHQTKVLLCQLILLMVLSCGSSRSDNELLQQLNLMINQKASYHAIKETDIENIKQILTLKNLTPIQQYKINKRLFEDYKKYCADSAIVYVLKNREIAFVLAEAEAEENAKAGIDASLKAIFKPEVITLENALSACFIKKDVGLELIAETAIQLSWLYSTVGMYIEASELLRGIDRRQLAGDLLSDYFEVYSSFCSHYGQSNNNPNYYMQSEIFRDSMLLSLDPQSFRYQIQHAAKQTFGPTPLPDTEAILLDLLKQADDTPDTGYIAWLLGYHYTRTGCNEAGKKYFALSAMSDIKHSIRDNASFQSLALMYFSQGDIALANRFINCAIDDALFCNVRYRISEASTHYPGINDIYVAQEEKQMKRLFASLVVISLLLIILIISLIVFYRQNHKLSRLSLALSEANR